MPTRLQRTTSTRSPARPDRAGFRRTWGVGKPAAADKRRSPSGGDSGQNRANHCTCPHVPTWRARPRLNAVERTFCCAVYRGVSNNRILANASGGASYTLALLPAIAALVSIQGLSPDLKSIARHLDATSGILADVDLVVGGSNRLGPKLKAKQRPAMRLGSMASTG